MFGLSLIYWNVPSLNGQHQELKLHSDLPDQQNAHEIWLRKERRGRMERAHRHHPKHHVNIDNDNNDGTEISQGGPTWNDDNLQKEDALLNEDLSTQIGKVKNLFERTSQQLQDKFDRSIPISKKILLIILLFNLFIAPTEQQWSLATNKLRKFAMLYRRFYEEGNILPTNSAVFQLLCIDLGRAMKLDSRSIPRDWLVKNKLKELLANLPTEQEYPSSTITYENEYKRKAQISGNYIDKFIIHSLF